MAASKSSKNAATLLPGLSTTELPYTISGSDSNPDCLIFLLYGPPDVCKTIYCRQFIEDGLASNEQCICSSLILSKRDFDIIVANSNRPSRLLLSLDIGTILPKTFGQSASKKQVMIERAMARLLKEITKSLQVCNNNNNNNTISTNEKLKIRKRKENKEKDKIQTNGVTQGGPKHDAQPVRFVLDSLAQLSLLIGDENLLRFLFGLITILKRFRVTAIFETSSSSTSELDLANRVKSLVDGTIELKVEESSESLKTTRKIRISSLRQSALGESKWQTLQLEANGRLSFQGTQRTSLTCTLCGKPIIGNPLTHSSLVFDSKSCLDTYQRLSEAFGQRFSDTGLPSEILDMSFFFVDIVGLSDPSLSVTSQIQKINALNMHIASCPVLKRLSEEKRIILPTGDGMVIGFKLNPTLPFELSIQLHQRLKEYNKEKPTEEHLAIRIGLASGPVFTVPDINNILNIWGPGVILARRVMDIGDEGHILLEGSLAEKLMVLSPEYASVIKLLNSDFQIKHGQRIRLYSAYSADFGNANQPSRLS